LAADGKLAMSFIPQTVPRKAATMKHDNGHEPEKELWCNVIRQAFDDALAPPSKNASEKVRQAFEFDRQRAVDWLTKPNLDFVQACHLAGVDPGYIRDNAKKVLAHG
jgi:hypothetical protein